MDIKSMLKISPSNLIYAFKNTANREIFPTLFKAHPEETYSTFFFLVKGE